MEQDSCTTVVNKANKACRYNRYNNEQELITNLSLAIRTNKDLFYRANEIDIKNNNGFKIDFNIIETILYKYKDVNPLIKSSDKISLLNNNLLQSKLYTKLGVVLCLFDGNTYTMLELIILGLLTHNSIIFAYNGYLQGTNGLLITTVQTILEQAELNIDMFNQSLLSNPEVYFDNYKSINKTLIIGDNDFINKYIKEATTEVIISGYKYYDIYIESIVDKDVLNNIYSLGLNINYYINNNLDLKIEDAIYVDDIEEAITYINYNSSKYSSSIFTDNSDNASKFLENVNSKYVMVNTSPTIEQALDIKEEDLLKEKVIMIPNSYKFDGNTIEI